MRSRPALLEGPVGPTLLRLAGPMVLGIAAILLFNVVDTLYVGRLGAVPLAAMGFTFPVVFLVMSIAMGMGVGLTSVVSRVIGEGDQGAVRRLTTHGLLLANLAVVVFALGGLLTIDPLFRLLGAGEDLLPLIHDYMTPWYLGVGFLVIPMVGNSAIRATGDTRTPSLIMIIAGGVNAVMDPLLIFGPGPFPRLGIQGAAFATVLSWTVTFVAAVWILARRERMLDFRTLHPRSVLASWRRVLVVALPASGTQIMIPLAGGVLTRMISDHGAHAVAAYGVGLRVESLSMIGMGALSSALAPFTGQNYGARRMDRVATALNFVLRAALLYGVMIAVLLALLAYPIAALFNDDPEVRRGIVRYLRLVPFSYGLYATSLLVASLFNAANRPLRSALLVAVRLFLLAVPLAWLGSRLADIPGLYLGIALANLLVGGLAVVMGKRFVSHEEIRHRGEIRERSAQRAAAE